MAVETRVRFPVTAFGLFLGLPVLNFPKRRDWVQKGCNTQGSHVITHRSTNWACRYLTSQIGRDGVLSPEYGRIQCGDHNGGALYQLSCVCSQHTEAPMV